MFKNKNVFSKLNQNQINSLEELSNKMKLIS